MITLVDTILYQLYYTCAHVESIPLYLTVPFSLCTSLDLSMGILTTTQLQYPRRAFGMLYTIDETVSDVYQQSSYPHEVPMDEPPPNTSGYEPEEIQRARDSERETKAKTVALKLGDKSIRFRYWTRDRP